MNEMQTGYLELIVGPMFSGKTTRLIEIYNKYQQKNVIAVNYSQDKRYSDTMLSSHDKKMIPCLFADNLNSILENPDITNSKVILINEGQFFPDIYNSVIKLVEEFNKKVYVCGLDGDFQRNLFGDLLKLVPLCDNIVKLRSNCDRCDNEASFSHRLTTESKQVVIGNNNYVPLCRTCYLKLTKNP